MQVCLDRPPPLGRLSLERPESSRLPVLLEDAQHGIDAQGTQQFVLEVAAADVEPVGCQILAGGHARRHQTTAYSSGLWLVVEPGDVHTGASRTQNVNIVPEIGDPAQRDDGDSIGIEVATPSRRKCSDRGLIAVALDEYRCARTGRPNRRRGSGDFLRNLAG